MTDSQLYLAIGLPSVVALIGILVNIGYFIAINGRMGNIESRMQSLEQKFDTRFDLLMGKLFELDNRLTRVEEQLKH
jgi:hypothetical protein